MYLSVLSAFTAKQLAATSARSVSSSPQSASKAACFNSTFHPVRFSISSHISASIPVHVPSSASKLYGSPVPAVTTVTVSSESFLSEASVVSFLLESSEELLLPQPTTVATTIADTSNAANTRFFIIIFLLFLLNNTLYLNGLCRVRSFLIHTGTFLL